LIGFPTLRLRGDYLAIVTLGFGEIIRVTMVYLEKLTGGAAGLKGVPAFTTVIELRPMLSFVWVYCFLVIVVILISNLIKSSPGRAIISVREDEIASNAMGINVFYYKMLAFVLSAFIAGIGGGLYAPFYRYLNPTSFNFMKSIDFIIIVVLGGMGSITGTIISGFVVTYLQEFLRFLEDFRLVIYALVLILMMLFRPTGLMGNKEFSITNLFAKIKNLLPPKDVTKEGADQ
ncbi:MAG TPA: branched-chain amino acid ABC transporter permease, partial [Bacillota bacterium]|nr:branched-chain amino acid ABC transporter permease [Bacillota bacterium]